MTSADLLRLGLVANLEDDPKSAVCQEQPATAAARIEPTVTQLEHHLESVYRYALRLTRRPDMAEDVAQETLLRGLRHESKLREPRAVRLWLFRIATNVWTDHLRKSKSGPLPLEAEPPCPRQLPTDASGEREHVQLALAAMDELPARQRQVLYLVTCEQLSHTEVADVLEIAPAAVKANLSLARKEMRARLKDIYETVCARTTCEAKSNET